MKKQPKTEKKCSIATKTISIVLLLVVVVGGISYAATHHNKQSTGPTIATSAKKPNVDYTPATSADNQASNQKKSAPPAGSTTNTTQASPSITVTRATLNADSLQVTAIVNNATSGTCTLTVSQAGQNSIVKTGAVALQVNTYACPVFSVPLDEFPNQGNWNVSVTINNNGETANAAWQGNPVSLSNN